MYIIKRCFNFYVDKLSTISRRVTENCISEMEKTTIKSKIHDIIKIYSSINNAIKGSSVVYKHNPYNNFINNKIETTFNFIKKPIKHMVKSKLDEINILKKLKLG
ncbi:hypothetical protein LL127_01015 [Clostridium estertheticum]|uniref:hypothetical protein n=1 Tax=Clostridium estertheticum TaxID=238834 RepID=UPI001CF23709|nr:hypothetical protein [Clostridium estertheticum]MCB2305507.1 hypothetical protein [Clostridium estertheticum]MCB2343946.1 hypothetical protein [Clostridium estertheticum]WAG46183.1 hypothetical protein LL127_01015 [Clostridium estertheticum]